MSSSYVYVGTYTTENWKKNRNAHGVGIYVYRIEDDGKWTLIQTVPTLNPAVLAFAPQMKYVYCVNSNSGNVSSFARDAETGKLTKLDETLTDGDNIMILSVSDDGRHMVTGDFNGTINLFSLNADGTFGEKTDMLVLPGEKGPLHEKIQPGSRPHHLPFSPNGKYVHMADKGLDLVHSYKLNEETNKLEAACTLKCHGASCPRHLWFHPNHKWAYINTEYTSTIIACDYNEETGEFTPFQVVSALPDDYFDVKNMTSELVVHPNGKSLYISNRGHESIGSFAIDQDSGRLTPINWVKCGGKKPRFFAIEPGGKYVFCGNQSSDTITVFEIDENTGGLVNTNKIIPSATPVWLLFTAPVMSVQGLQDVE